MNKNELREWQDAVLEYCKMVITLKNDCKTIEELMKQHLSEFFDWDDIVFDDDFNTIKLVWKYGVEPVIKVKDISGLGMDFYMSNEFYKDLGQCNTIILYPFGLPKEGVIIER